MKHSKKLDKTKNRTNKAKHRIQTPTNDQVTEMLKACLQKVCELQQDLERSENIEEDATAAGYAACAVETLRFLSAEGLPEDHPVVKAMGETFAMAKD